jgi:hypothetical protein
MKRLLGAMLAVSALLAVQATAAEAQQGPADTDGPRWHLADVGLVAVPGSRSSWCLPRATPCNLRHRRSSATTTRSTAPLVCAPRSGL